MSYQELYIDLAQTLIELGCYVCDHDFWGYCYHTKTIKAFVVIKSSMSYKYKYFTLIHEAGHLFYPNNVTLFNWSKKARTEKQANSFAVKILKLKELEVDDYETFYNRAKEIAKNRKKSWHEIL